MRPTTERPESSEDAEGTSASDSDDVGHGVEAGPPASAITETLPPEVRRPLEPEEPPPTVRVRSAGHHTFLFQKMIIGPEKGRAPRDGDLARVIDRDGVPLGHGLWNRRSQITLRLIQKGETPPGPDFWKARIEDAVALRRGPLGLNDPAGACRLIHAEGDGLSGLIVDRYADVLAIEVFSLGIHQRLGPLLELLLERTGAKRFLAKFDDKAARGEGFRTVPEPLASEPAPRSVEIQEHGIRYLVRFDDGHKTGFFCDQRENRRAFARFCRDRSVLDVCCYSGGFGLSALMLGGASEVTGVDLDENALAMARKNANLNQKRLSLVQSDAFGYLRQMAQNGRSFGAVALDPPKLIGSRAEFDVGRKKYLDLNALAMGVVEPGGLLLSCSCSGLLSPSAFLETLKRAARKANRSARLIALTGAGPDHPTALETPEGSYLKAAWLILGESAS